MKIRSSCFLSLVGSQLLLSLDNLGELCFIAMLKKPVVTEVRTPTNTWSGLGFSKSMPAETIKELRRANHVSYKPSMSTTYEVWKCSVVFKMHVRNWT